MSTHRANCSRSFIGHWRPYQYINTHTLAPLRTYCCASVHAFIRQHASCASAWIQGIVHVGFFRVLSRHRSTLPLASLHVVRIVPVQPTTVTLQRNGRGLNGLVDVPSALFLVRIAQCTPHPKQRPSVDSWVKSLTEAWQQRSFCSRSDRRDRAREKTTSCQTRSSSRYLSTATLLSQADGDTYLRFWIAVWEFLDGLLEEQTCPRWESMSRMKV